MNKPLRHVAVVIGLLMISLVINITVSDIFRYPGLNEMSQNRRVRDVEFASERGAIMVGTTAIAATQATTSSQFPYERIYSAGEMYAPVTGYYSYDYGRTGLEKTYNEELSGTSDSQAFGRLKSALLGRSASGAQLTTTINANAQKAAWDGLGSMNGAVVAIDYTTGAILAYVSKPSYDPNLLSTIDIGAAAKSWSTLSNSDDKVMLNRAGKEIFPPGSTFKLITAAAALENGMAPDSVVDSPERLTLPQSSSVLTNETYCGGDKITITKAVEVSCNTAFANIGMSLGENKLRAQAEKFGFNSTISSDLDPVKSRFPTQLDQAQTALSSIGQFDVAATPLQMAMVAAGIANAGVVMEPFLVSEIRNPDLTLLRSHRPQQLSQAVSADTATKLQDMMVSAVNNGTGRNARIPGMKIGGKTGTAQTAADRPPYAWFVGFAEEPHVAIAVFVQDAKTNRANISGGRLAAPVFRDVVKALS